jgi:5'-nucleotidase/UDP-sugar diphosphatase
MGNDINGEHILRLVRRVPNPAGADGAQLFILKGDATREPLSLEIPAGMQITPPWRYDSQPFRLKILHFNDLHGNILHIGRNENIPVFSKIVSRIRQTRLTCQENPFATVLVLSGGDDIIGSPFDMLVSSDPESYQVHPGYRLYSKAGIDAAVLGNHEFDLGLDFLAQAIRKDTSFPILSANLRPTEQLEKVCDPAAIFILKGIRIGIIGLTTPAEKRSRQGSEFEIVDPIPVVKRLLPIVRSLCDVVIILSHLGQSLRSSSASMASAGDVELAQNLPFGSVELIIGGHTHDPINESGLEPKNVVNGIPITQAGSNGRYLGEVDIVIHNAPTVAKVGLNYTAELPVDVSFEENYVQPLYKQIRPQFEKRLGRVVDNQEIVTEVCYNDAAYSESALHNFVTDSLVTRCRAHGLAVDFGMVDACVIKSCLQPGKEITYGDWRRVMPYADTLVFCTLTGKELYVFIQDNAQRIDISGEPHKERGFQHFSKEIRYRIQINRDRSQIKAVDIQVRGIPIEQVLDHTYRVACLSFFRMLARNWEQQTVEKMPLLVFYPNEAHGVDTGLFVNDFIMEHIQQYDGITLEGGALRDGRMITF